MATEKQTSEWLNITENYIKRQEKNAANELIKQIWTNELKDFQDWRSSLRTKTPK